MSATHRAATLLTLDGLKGKAALITGSTSGIGLGIATALAEAGVDVMLNGFGDPQAIEAERAKLAALGVKALHSAADMSKGDEVEALVARTEREFGRLDILVNNAGIQHVAPVEDFPPQKWQQIIAINLSSNFHTIHAALAGMKQRGYGRIINIASAHGLVASPYKAAYVAAKHGVVGLTKTVALEVAEQNITVNAICPGYVKTPLVENQIADQANAHNMPADQVIREVILAAQPNKRFAEIAEIAALALFLCSDAARSMTGRAISIDGGWTAR